MGLYWVSLASIWERSPGTAVQVSPLNAIKSLEVSQKASQRHTVQLLTFWQHSGGPH